MCGEGGGGMEIGIGIFFILINFQYLKSIINMLITLKTKAAK